VVIAAAAAAVACNAYAPAQGKSHEPAISTLSVSCKPGDKTLECRAIGQPVQVAPDLRGDADMTDAVAWSTSNPKTAAVVRGRITAHAPGTATIVASTRSAGELVSSSVLVVVDDEGDCPQIGYELKGMVRELTNYGIDNVELTLIDDGGRARGTMTTEADGGFRFAPLLTGRYRIRAAKPGFRAVERAVNVPDAAPLTLVLLAEPKS